MSKREFTWYVALFRSDRCRCGRRKERKKWFCPECWARLTRQAQESLGPPPGAELLHAGPVARFRHACAAYDAVEAGLAGGAEQ